jgi:tRNA(fMet)-specific endonuclease VapC
MALCYDTNILIFLVRDNSRNERIRDIINPERKNEYISIVTSAEIKSIAIQNGWGRTRQEKMQKLIDALNVIDIASTEIIDRYVEIDTFSQCKNTSIPSSFATPRNMGKNDLWTVRRCDCRYCITS